MWSSLVRLSILKWISAGLIAWGAAAAPVQQSDTLPIAEFWKHIQSTLSIVDGLKNSSAGEVRSGLDQEAAYWQAVKAVRMDDGTVVPIDTSVLVGELRADPPDTAKLTAHLQTLLDARDHWRDVLAGSSSGSSQSSGDPYLALKQILSAPEFQPAEQPVNPIQAWLDKLIQQFWQWLFNLLPPEMAGSFSLVRVALVLVGGLILLAVLWYAIRRISSGLVSENELDLLDPGGEDVITSESALQRAQETSHAGDYRSAVRWLYLSSLLTLEERGLLRYDRSRTNREYLRSVANAPDLAHSLRDIIDVFDRVWYGFQPVDADTFEQYTRRVTELRRVK